MAEAGRMATAVVGLGPVGQALAAHLSSMGHTVRALEVAGGTVAAVRERGGVTARGALERSARTSCAAEKNFGPMCAGGLRPACH